MRHSVIFVESFVAPPSERDTVTKNSPDSGVRPKSRRAVGAALRGRPLTSRSTIARTGRSHFRGLRRAPLVVSIFLSRTP